MVIDKNKENEDNRLGYVTLAEMKELEDNMHAKLTAISQYITAMKRAIGDAQDEITALKVGAHSHIGMTMK